MKFGSLSGAGWLLDLGILLILVGGFGAPTFGANVASSCTAAVTVFLLSRRLVFASVGDKLGIRVAAYLAYTLCMIVLAGAAMTLIVHALGALAQARGLRVGASTLAAIAKAAVTPPTLILNYLMSRRAAETVFGFRDGERGEAR